MAGGNPDSCKVRAALYRSILMKIFAKVRTMKLLLTGSAGMLGSSLIPVLKENGHTVLSTDIRFISKEMKHLDVRRVDQMLATAIEFRPDMIVHLAAETDLEVCETRIDYAFEENFIGTQNACIVCRELAIPIVYVSTAGVFDGKKKEPYTEFDFPNPINVYGASKLEGEHIVRETLPNHLIVRAGWMIGGGERDRKFVSKILKQLDEGAKDIYAVDDRFGTPTYAPAFARVLERLMSTRYFGTYHLACKGHASRYDVASKILELLGRKDVKIHAVTSDYFKEQYFAPRPVSEEMRNYVLELRGMNDMPPWTDALETYLKTYFSRHFR